MLTFSQVEQIAAGGGYNAAARDISRVTVATVHKVYAGLARCDGQRDEVQAATVAVSRLRRWIVYGDGTPPPVRGAGYLHSNREVWMAYTEHHEPAQLRGRAAALAELRSYLAMAISPDFEGSLLARTHPAVRVEANEGKVVLNSDLGIVALSVRAASYVEHWISVSMRPRDKRGVLCLPDRWDPA